MKFIYEKNHIFFICFIIKLLGVQIFKSLMIIKAAFTLIICETLEDPLMFLDILIRTVSLRPSNLIKFFVQICLGSLVLMAYLVRLLIHALRNFTTRKFINANFVKGYFVIEQKYVLSIIIIRKIFKFKNYAKVCILKLKNKIRLN